jgi:undecaprenyl phosphate-alpha-L-ara4N flippase subunit ArnE
MRTKLEAFIFILLSTVLISSAQILLKIGAVNLPTLNWELFVGFTFLIMATLFLVLGLKRGEVSVLYPILATSYIWVILLSVSFFDEQLGLLKIIGMASIVVGIMFVGFGSRNGGFEQ